jgi:hypothetical protein
MSGVRLKDAGIVLGGMNNAFNADAVGDGLIEDQVLFKMADSPHSQSWELHGLTSSADMHGLRKFVEGITGFSEEAARRAQAAMFTDISEVPNKVSPSGGPYDSSGHARLSLLSGAHEGNSGALDFSPIIVFHFRSFPAGLGLFDESVNSLLPVSVHRNRPSIIDSEAQKEFGRFLKELFTAGELAALNGLINTFLEVGWQGYVYHTDLHTAFYAIGHHFSPLDFEASSCKQSSERRAAKVEPMAALRYE